jgi:hypothetical protein
MASTNIVMLQTVATGLGNLKDEMVFVGGAVAELYASDPAASYIIKILPDGTEFFVFPTEYYLASKFEAHNNRGGNDLR